MNKEQKTQTHEWAKNNTMKAVRVHHFGGIKAMVYEEVPLPVPGNEQVLVSVKAAGVGPWDAWVRSGQSALPQPLPLTLGSDLSGIIQAVGPGVSKFQIGDEVFGVTNAQFTGAYAEFAIAQMGMIALKPPQISHIEAAALPVVASTAWQMVFDHGQVDHTKRVLIHGAAGNVGAYAVQLAKRAGAEVTATAFTHSLDFVRTLGADHVIDVNTTRFEKEAMDVDVVIDTIGGDTLDRSFAVLKAGGVLVSAVESPDQDKARRYGVRALFFLVSVTTLGLTQISDLAMSSQLHINLGEVLPLSQAPLAHGMLAGAPHKPGKIVLTVDP